VASREGRGSLQLTAALQNSATFETRQTRLSVMPRSVFQDLSADPMDLFLVVSGLPALESMLPLVWNEKRKNPNIRARAIFLREGTLTGFGKSHPLLILAMEVLDEILVPYGLKWIRWSGPLDNSILNALFRKSSRASRALSLMVSNLTITKVMKKNGNLKRPFVTLFDFGYLPSDQMYQTTLSKLSGDMAVGLSHGSTLSFQKNPPGYLETRTDGTFFAGLRSLLTSKLTLFYFDAMPRKLDMGDIVLAPPPIERFDINWRAFIRKVFDKRMAELEAAPLLGLLVSRHASVGAGADSQSLAPSLRRQALKDIRHSMEKCGLKPVVILHPSEVRIASELTGWLVVTDIHYSVLFSESTAIVTFGTQLSEDYWRMGGKMIEYSPVRKLEFHSEFSKSEKTTRVDSLLGLEEALAEAIRLKMSS